MQCKATHFYWAGSCALCARTLIEASIDCNHTAIAHRGLIDSVVDPCQFNRAAENLQWFPFSWSLILSYMRYARRIAWNLWMYGRSSYSMLCDLIPMVYTTHSCVENAAIWRCKESDTLHPGSTKKCFSSSQSLPSMELRTHLAQQLRGEEHDEVSIHYLFDAWWVIYAYMTHLVSGKCGWIIVNSSAVAWLGHTSISLFQRVRESK